MARVLLDEHDPTLRTLIDSDEDGNLVVQNGQECGEVTERNTRIRNEIGKGIPKNHDDMRYVASISGIALFEAMRSGLISEDPSGGWHILDQKRFRKWLNDRDNRAWRTCEGKV